ncbi:MAG: serine/threonine-protein kinase [Myxococcota bacterium]
MHQPGDHIDIWVVDKQLGSGGMGSVYRCHNRNAPRILAAVKVLESSLRRNPEAEARFVREAEILHSLDHPHIVKVRNVRTDSDPPYLEMEFVAGQSLEDWLIEGPVDYGRAVRLMHQMAQAIAYLHGKGIRHRDIKPANLLVQDGHQIKLVDFGLAVETDRTRITQHGMAFGTVSYAPPEWIHPETLDPRKWDLYALGVVFFEMLTGRFAFPVSGQGSARQQAMQVIVGKQGHRPLDPGSTFPEPVRELIKSLTHADPHQRASDIEAIVKRLAAIVQVAPEPAASPIVNPEAIPEPPDHTVPSRNSPATWLSEQGGITVEQFGRTGWWIAGAVGSVGLVLLGVAALIVVTVLTSRTAARDVHVTLGEASSDVHLTLDGQAPVRVAGPVWQFESIPVGDDVLLRWARGAECRVEACPGDSCARWCGAGDEPVVVPKGDGVHAFDFEVPPARPRSFSFVFTNYDADDRLNVTLDGESGTRSGKVMRFDGVRPGPRTLAVRAGKCPADQPACWPEGDCPARCLVHETQIVVPWSVDDDRLAIDMPAPKRGGLIRQAVNAVLRPNKAPPPAPAPKPPSVRAKTSHGVATTGGFAAWLADHPEWQSDGGKGSVQGSDYLSGWQGATPPAGRSTASPMVNLTYVAARAYCKGRGGLVGLDAPPLDWAESDVAPSFEWRENGLNRAVRSSLGESLRDMGITRGMMSVTGVRCAR